MTFTLSSFRESPSARVFHARMLAFLLAVTPGALRSQSPTVQHASAATSDSTSISLSDALSRALSRSQEVRLARTQLDYANAQVRGARSAALPQLDASVAYTRTYQSPFGGTSGGTSIPAFSPDSTASLEQRISYLERNTPTSGMGALGSLFGNLPFGRPNTYAVSVTGTQTLWSGGRVGAALDVAEQYRRASELGYAEQVADIELQIRTVYYKALLAQELERISGAAVTQAEAFLSQEKLRKSAGNASDLEVLRAEVSLENLKPQLVQARNAASLATLDLKRLIDIPLTQPITLTSLLSMPSAVELASARTDASTLLASRPAVQAQERQVTMREDQVKIAKGAFLPSVGLSVTYGKQLMPQQVFGFGGQSWLGNTSASLGVNIPIFSGFRRQAELDQASIQLEQERLRLTQLQKSVQLQYEQALGERQRAAADLTARQRTVDQAQRVHDMTVLRYEKGLATQLEVSDARLSLLQARTNLAQAISSFYLADAGVARAAGTSSTARTLVK